MIVMQHLVVHLFVSVTALAAVLLQAPASAAAQTEPVLRIGKDYADSKCIGDISTPVCAAETVLACLTRADLHLCTLVGIPGILDFIKSKDENVPRRRLVYRIVGVEPVDELTKILIHVRDDSLDLADVRVLEEYCREGETCRPPAFRRSIFLIRGPKGWFFLRMAQATDDFSACNEFPEHCDELLKYRQKYFVEYGDIWAREGSLD